MSAWIAIVLCGAGSYLLRVSMLVVAARGGLPPAVARAARYAVPTTFVVLVTTSLMGSVAIDRASIGPAVAVVAGALAVHRTGSRHAALLVGMPTVCLLGALLAG